MNRLMDAINNGLNYILAYLMMTLLISIGLGIAILALGINKPNPQDGARKCYYGADMSYINRFVLNAKGRNLTGTKPKTINDIGQTSDWVDTGYITTGSPMQIYANGEWYPWGESANAFDISYRPVSVADSSTEGSTIKYEEYIGKTVCKTNIDLNNFQLGSEETKNHLLRYRNKSSKSTPIPQQIVKLLDVHCLDGSSCNIIRSPGRHDFSACALSGGTGVYMKIGDANYAYHIMGHYVHVYEKYRDEATGDIKTRPKYDVSGDMAVTLVPFTLPTKIYDQSKMNNEILGASTTDRRFMFVDSDSVAGIQLARDGNVTAGCVQSINANPDIPNELCSPAPNQKIYVNVNDIYYEDNDGEVEIIFKTGAVSAKRAGKEGLISTISSFFLKPLFGDLALLKYDRTKNSSRDYGAIGILRDAILSNMAFQIIKYIALILWVSSYGLKMMRGEKKVSFGAISKDSVVIGLAVWGTTPGAYEVIDSLLIPIMFEWLEEFGGLLMRSAASIAGITVLSRNAIDIIDEMIGALYSPVVGYKIMALFSSTGIGILLLLPLFIIILAVSAEAMISAIGFSLSIAGMGLMLALLPVTLLGSFNEHTAHYFARWRGIIMREMFHSSMILFVVGIILGLVIHYYYKLLGFDICWQEIYRWEIFGLILKTYSWKTVANGLTPEFTLTMLQNTMTLALMTTMFMRSSDLASKYVNAIFQSSPIGNDGKSALKAIKSGLFGGDNKMGVLSPLAATRAGSAFRSGLEGFVSNPSGSMMNAISGLGAQLRTSVVDSVKKDIKARELSSRNKRLAEYNKQLSGAEADNVAQAKSIDKLRSMQKDMSSAFSDIKNNAKVPQVSGGSDNARNINMSGFQPDRNIGDVSQMGNKVDALTSNRLPPSKYNALADLINLKSVNKLQDNLLSLYRSLDKAEQSATRSDLSDIIPEISIDSSVSQSESYEEAPQIDIPIQNEIADIGSDPLEVSGHQDVIEHETDVLPTSQPDAREESDNSNQDKPKDSDEESSATKEAVERMRREAAMIADKREIRAIKNAIQNVLTNTATLEKLMHDPSATKDIIAAKLADVVEGTSLLGNLSSKRGITLQLGDGPTDMNAATIGQYLSNIESQSKILEFMTNRKRPK